MNQEQPSLSKLDGILSRPIVDKTIAVLAVLPFVLLIWLYLRQTPIVIETILNVANLAVTTVTMLLRHPPRRVTQNPLFWLLALTVTYWIFFMHGFYQVGERVVPEWTSLSLVVIGVALTIWARLSLGRNIGLVPAERRIVCRGPYAYIRHPIYAGLFLSILGWMLAGFTLRNLALNAVWIGLFAYKSLVEEKFLRQSDEYAAYLRQVRWRWLPYVF